MSMSTVAIGRTDKNLTPTDCACAELQASYTYYNDCLFDRKLPECMLNVEITKRSYYGYFRPYGFADAQGHPAHQICINPHYIFSRDTRDVLSTLVHEMCHLEVFESKSKKRTTGYHCRKWVALMESIGLIPSNTGQPGGRKTGYQMTHYVQDGGAFDRVTKRLLDGGFTLTWGAGHQLTTSAKSKNASKGKDKYVCPVCGVTAWAAPSRNLVCGDDLARMERSLT